MSTAIINVQINDADVEVQYALPTKRSEVAVTDEQYSTVLKPKVSYKLKSYYKAGIDREFICLGGKRVEPK